MRFSLFFVFVPAVIRGFTDIPRYLSIDGVGAVLVAPNIVLVLDCYFFGFRLYGQQWNVSALEWSFNNVPIGLIESRRLQLRNSGIQLVINSTTLESGAEDSTDGLYSCRVCAFDGRCQRTNTRIMIFGECNCCLSFVYSLICCVLG